MTKLAHVIGRADTPLIEDTIGAFLDRATAMHANRTALVSCHQGVRLSYAQLRQHTDALACGLLRLGLQPGDRVGIWAPNCVEWALVQFATAKAGMILVNVNPAYRSSELEYAINKVGMRCLIMSPSFKTSDYIGMVSALAPELVENKPATRLPSLEVLIRLGEDRTSGFVNFDTLLEPPSEDELAKLARQGEALHSDDPVNIQFTSGTTGAPKGATLTHRNILNNGFFVGEAIGLTPGDTLCIPVPLYHCFGMVMGNLGCLTHGATMVYPSEAFEPGAVLEALAEERCAGIYAVPTMFIAMLDHAERESFDLSALRTGIMAGSPCPTEIMKKVIEEIGCRGVTIAYGMTETSPVSFQSDQTDPIERRVSTVGRIQPHCEVKIIDKDGQTLKRGEMGELCTRGYLVMQGYWGDEDRTRDAIDDDGFMHTGDLAVIDEAGYCKITGRLKDMVIRGGENIYPREIEEYLYRHPKINDVQVVGVPDPLYGEELCACIIASDPSLTADELRAFCEGRIAHYKIPRHVEFMEDFPMTVTGKIQKYVLRDRVARKLGLVGQTTC